MEDQSSYVSSSSTGHDAHETPQEMPRAPEKSWDDMDDVLDLTGGAGQFSHPAFSVSFPSKPAEEEEEDRRSYSDSLEPSPEDEESDSIGGSSSLPSAPVLPSAPEEEPARPAAPYSAPSSGSLDVNLFPLPASSAPLVHSSSADFQPPSNTGQEELSPQPLEPTPLPPLFPLSADYSKDHAGTFSADSASPEALPESVSDFYAVPRTMEGSVAGNLGYDVKTDHADVDSPVSGHVREDLIFSERGHAVEHPTSQLETVSGDYTKVYTQSAREMFSGMLKSVGPPHEEFSDIKEGVDEQYVDFKPFGGTRAYETEYEPKYVAVDLKTNIGALNFESAVKAEEKDVDLSDDISPASDSSNELFAPLKQAAPLAFEANKTDEKKVEDSDARTFPASNIATVNPFFEHLDQGVGYVLTEGSAHKPEGLTPDIVQEAHESDVYESGIQKSGYEPKIDLVQTAAKASAENVSPTVHSAPLFEDPDSVSSPVLPDIVMEAPIASAPVSFNTMAPQPDVSPVGHVTPVSEEKIKFESEKPPSYEEATNKASLHDAVHVEATKESPVQASDSPYISIACDLVKETRPEQPTDFSKSLKSEFDAQFTPNFDESSPESEQSEPSYKHWEPQVIPKQPPAAIVGTVKLQDASPEKEHEGIPEWKGASSGEAYLESYQPQDTSISADEPFRLPEQLSTSAKEKPLQMEEFGQAVFSEEASHEKEPVPLQKPSAAETHKDDEWVEVKETKREDDQPKSKEDLSAQDKITGNVPSSDDGKKGYEPSLDQSASPPLPPAKDPRADTPSSNEKNVGPLAPAPLVSCVSKTSVVDLVYWRDIKKSGAVFGASLFLLLSLTVFSIVSVSAYIALGLLSVTISFRIYKGVLQAIQKSDEGHPFKSCLECNVAVSEELVQKYCNVALGHINCTIKELRRLFLVEDLVDSLKFAVLMWVFTYIGALFNGLTLLILGLISLFSIPVIYERHQTQVDHYLGLISKNVKNTTDLIASKIPGLKRKTE